MSLSRSSSKGILEIDASVSLQDEASQMLDSEEVSSGKMTIEAFFAFVEKELKDMQENIVSNPLSFDEVSYKIAVAKNESINAELEKQLEEVFNVLDKDKFETLAAEEKLTTQKAENKNDIKSIKARKQQYAKDFNLVKRQLTQAQVPQAEANYSKIIAGFDADIHTLRTKQIECKHKLLQADDKLLALETKAVEIATAFQKAFSICDKIKVALDDAKTMTVKVKKAESEAQEKAEHAKQEKLRQDLATSWLTILEEYKTNRNEKYKVADGIKKAAAPIGNFFSGEKRYIPGELRQTYIDELTASLKQYAKIGSVNDQYGLGVKLHQGIVLFKPRSGKDKEQSLQSCLQKIESELNTKKK